MFGLLAFLSVCIITLELIFLHTLSNQDFEATLQIHPSENHLSPNNLFAKSGSIASDGLEVTSISKPTDEKPKFDGPEVNGDGKTDNLLDVKRPGNITTTISKPTDEKPKLDGPEVNGDGKTQNLIGVNPPGNITTSISKPTDEHSKLIAIAKQRGLTNVDDKGPILEILTQAGLKIENEDDLDQDTLNQLPTWTQILRLYGPDPKIQGLERCEEFRNAVEPTTRFFGMAGTFNTGTNLIHDMMKYNCQITERMEAYGEKSKGVRWQVPWGKHRMASERDSDHVTNTDSDVPRENILPLVSIRDPYSWMQSMCRHRYAARWVHMEDRCPNLVALEADLEANKDLKKLFNSDAHKNDEEKLVPVRIKYAEDTWHKHDSLAHFYSDWYGEYLNADFPRLMVRFEDLLFHGEKVIRTLCDCGGGVPRKDNGRSGAFAHISESAKKGPNAHGPKAARTNLVGALIRYGTFANRTDTMTPEDLMAARKHLDPAIMDAFGYVHPAEDDLSMQSKE